MAKHEHPERAFDRLVTQIGDSGFIPDAVFPGGSRDEPQTMNEFLGQFVGCRKSLSANARRSLNGVYEEQLGVSLRKEQINTYAKAARRIRELRRGESTLRRSAVK